MTVPKFHFFARNRGSAKISKSVNYSPRLSRRATPKRRPASPFSLIASISILFLQLSWSRDQHHGTNLPGQLLAVLLIIQHECMQCYWSTSYADMPFLERGVMLGVC